MIEIRSKRKIPEGGQGVKKYPFETMKVGESFLYTDHADDLTVACQRICAIAATWKARHGSKKKFTCRREIDGIGVYRTR